MKELKVLESWKKELPARTKRSCDTSEQLRNEIRKMQATIYKMLQFVLVKVPSAQILCECISLVGWNFQLSCWTSWLSLSLEEMHRSLCSALELYGEMLRKLLGTWFFRWFSHLVLRNVWISTLLYLKIYKSINTLSTEIRISNDLKHTFEEKDSYYLGRLEYL